MLKLNNLFNQKNCHSNWGFTLIELLVVTAIMALLVGAVVASHRTGQKKYTLSQTAQRLVSDLRKAQNMAMSGVDIGGQYCGYGLEINQSVRPTSYRFYADKAADCQTSNNKYDASDEIIETVDLPNQIQFRSTSPAPLDIFFKPPEPTTYINQDAGAGVSGTIILEIAGTSFTKTIMATTAGLIKSD